MSNLRLWFGGIVGLALAGVGMILLVQEIRFGSEAVSTTATVESYTGRRLFGRGGGWVVHDVDGQPVRASFRSWSIARRGPSDGERVQVLYLRAKPNEVALDSFLQRYGAVLSPFILAFAIAKACGVFRRRRGSSAQGA